jgi:uncharacterized protein
MKNVHPYLAPAAVLGTALIVAAALMSWSAVRIKNSDHTIEVTGSARQSITSDRAIWSTAVAYQSPTLQTSYQALSAGTTRVKNYLVTQGIPEKEITLGPVRTQRLTTRQANGTETAGNYQLEQTLTVATKNIALVERIAREVTQLINEDVPVESHAPQYFVSDLADKKVQMLSEAAKNARLRAEKIAESVGSHVGSIRSADMGVLQITPAGSTEVSNDGMSDTSSIEKDITSVVRMTFSVN